MRNPTWILFSWVFLLIRMTPSPGLSAVNRWKERWMRHHLMLRSVGPNTVSSVAKTGEEMVNRRKTGRKREGFSWHETLQLEANRVKSRFRRE
jgi:hypothetical protein